MRQKGDNNFIIELILLKLLNKIWEMDVDRDEDKDKDFLSKL